MEGVPMKTKCTAALLTLAIAITAPAQWEQDEFAIVAHWDPSGMFPVDGVATGNSAAVQEANDEDLLRICRNAGFNVLANVETVWDPGMAASRYRNLNENRYLLERIEAIGGGLRAFVPDPRYSDPTGGPYTWVQADVNDVISDYTTGNGGLSADLRELIYGFHVTDEPRFANTGATGNLITKFHYMNQNAQDIPSWINLFGNRHPDFLDANHNQIGTNFADYVQRLIDAEARVISFDNYPFITNDGGVTLRTRPHFFGGYQTVAELIRESGRRISFWAYASAIEEVRFDAAGNAVQEQDGPADYRTNIDPAQLRYSAHVPLLYGGTGIVWLYYMPPWRHACAAPPCATWNCGSCGGRDWYCDPVPTPPATCRAKALEGGHRFDESITDLEGQATPGRYAQVTTVNTRLQRMGPTLLRMEWIETVHGDADHNMNTTDGTFAVLAPEGNLPVIEADTPLLQPLSADVDFAAGIFRDRFQPNVNYLLVMNKDLDVDNTFTINCKNTVHRVDRFSSTNDRWNILASGISGGPVTLADIPPGDVVLLRINYTDMTPVLNLLLLD